MKNKIVLFSLLFLAAFVVSTKVEAKTVYLQKNASYQAKQFVNKKVKEIKYNKKYVKVKNGYDLSTNQAIGIKKIKTPLKIDNEILYEEDGDNLRIFDINKQVRFYLTYF